MKVKLLSSRAVAVKGGHTVQNVGDIVEMSDKEAAVHIERGLASPVPAEKPHNRT